jgi:hypothetical protein
MSQSADSEGGELEVVTDCVAKQVLAADTCFFATSADIGFTDLDRLTI